MNPFELEIRQLKGQLSAELDDLTLQHKNRQKELRDKFEESYQNETSRFLEEKAEVRADYNSRIDEANKKYISYLEARGERDRERSVYAILHRMHEICRAKGESEIKFTLPQDDGSSVTATISFDNTKNENS